VSDEIDVAETPADETMPDVEELAVAEPAETPEDIARRKAVIEAGRSDVERWSDPANLLAAWERRSVIAAHYVPAGARVVDLGCGAMTIERHLPFGCYYRPVDIVARDERTIVCDFNRGQFPAEALRDADFVVALGLLEYVYDLPALLHRLTLHRLPALVTYCPADKSPGLDRRALGWVNDFTIAQFLALLEACGLTPDTVEHIDDLQIMVRLAPDKRIVPARKKVVIVSAVQTPNLGDRLGYHVLAPLLPPGAEVVHGYVLDLESVRDESCDLLVIGTGNSVFSHCLSADLEQLMNRSARTIGIFGTQYREDIAPKAMGNFLSRLDIWFARYRDDLTMYARGRSNAIHLGDWLISQFPMARGTVDQPAIIDTEFSELPNLDLAIRSIQQYKNVLSTHLHPLLCALTSAETVAYREQRDLSYRPELAAGKFRSMLLDVFGRHFPEEAFFPVNRDFVARYKDLVDRNIQTLRSTLRSMI
jgi:hypothetical protein